ncbi:MAG: FKBP-type peptidyl-prolyl cis-trans isomerase [Bacteroidota bacterium]
MRYLGAILVVGFGLLFFACDEEEALSVVEQYNLEQEKIDNYLTENGITDTLIHNPSNIRYTINAIGDGITPLLSDSIYVDYEGRFLDTEEIFDGNEELGMILGQTILGWQVMVSEMREGDDYTIYLPSYYAYGTHGSGSTIPANATLIFDIRLIRVAN